MSELHRQLEAARPHITASWDDERVRRSLRRLKLRIRRRRIATGAAMVTGLAALVPLLLFFRPETRVAQAPRPGEAEPADAPHELRLSDGSSARAVEPETTLKLVEDTPARVTVALERGLGEFDVRRRPERVFHVKAGDIQITVLGTEFAVDRGESAVGVWVTRGRVRVDWPGGTAMLGAGQHGWYPPAVDADEEAEAEPQDVGPAEGPRVKGHVHPARAHARHAAGAVAQGWKALAESGRYAEAYAGLRNHPARKLTDPETLLLAADVARLSGHPNSAVPYLERVITHHRADARAPLAAFSLGRILLNVLGRSGEAAVRFAESRSLAPSGSLAQDALAREVEAWSRAGLPGKARDAAEEYLRLYPGGRRATAVKRYGGLE